MPRHDPVPPTGGDEAPQPSQRMQEAWRRYRNLMTWMAAAAAVAVALALVYLKATGTPMPIHMVVATIAGVGFSVLLGTALMGLVYFSNHSGHDETISAKGGERDPD